MTDEKMRIAIAGIMGFKNIALRAVGDPENGCGYYDYTDGELGRGGIVIPDYPTCLNACRRMERYLKPSQQNEYAYWVKEIACPITGEDWEAIHATAAQRCEAFLKTLGLYVEDGQ